MAGRGANHNVEHRFSGPQIETVDDGWSQSDWDAAFAASAPRTEVTEISARSCISYNDSPDLPFSRSINPYQGCELDILPHLSASRHRRGIPITG